MQHFPFHFILTNKINFPYFLQRYILFIRRLPGIDTITTAQDLKNERCFYLSAINLLFSFYFLNSMTMKWLSMISFVVVGFIWLVNQRISWHRMMFIFFIFLAHCFMLFSSHISITLKNQFTLTLTSQVYQSFIYFLVDWIVWQIYWIRTITLSILIAYFYHLSNFATYLQTYLWDILSFP